jgi:hypothetical protein
VVGGDVERRRRGVCGGFRQQDVRTELVQSKVEAFSRRQMYSSIDYRVLFDITMLLQADGW